MSIHALPQAAVRTIRSGQALTDPASVVKELIDNALDARATNIAVEISANTLDVIQVKDNGHGIAPADRSLVAKPHCTSKLKDETDLATVGSSYLGFRGEALNSALEMSGDMIITTRVEGESVATAIQVSQTGEPIQERATHPPGTTVRITNFLKSQPVRRQVALKSAARVLTRIKQLLQAYAFARPATRLSVKVIKAKNDKDNWTYAPKVGSGIEDTALKVVGKPCASQCVWAELEHEGFVAQALLPRPDAHAPKISGLGQYVSVNDRPLTPSRGISKQLVKIYKEALRNSGSLSDVKDPFLYLSLSCPPGSYDANIEPAKDDVLFGDVDKVVETVRRLMLISYPEEESHHAVLTHQAPAKSNGLTERELFQTPESRSKPAAAEPKNNMYDLDEDDLTMFMDSVDQPGQADVEDMEEQPESTRSAALSNPWVMAKMNAYTKQRKNVDIQLMTPANHASSSIPATSSPLVEAQPNQQVAPGLLTPRQSSPIHPQLVEVSSIGPSQVSGPINLSAPVPSSGLGTSILGQSMDQPEGSPAPRRTSLPPQPAALGMPLDMIPEATNRQRSPAKRQFVNKPFVSPIDPERDAWFHFPEQRQKQWPRKGRPQRLVGEGMVPSGEPYSQPQILTPPVNNTNIRTFLGRGREQQSATPTANETTSPQIENTPPAEIDRAQQPRGFMRASELDLDSTQFVESTRPAPSKTRRRKTTDDRALNEISGNGNTIDESSETEYENRPRRRRTGESEPKKPRRTKSSTLPLEKVPPSAQLQGWHGVSNALIADIGKGLQVLDAAGSLVAWNQPAFSTPADARRIFTELDAQRWTVALSTLLLKREPDSELVRDLGDVVKNAMSRWGNFAQA